VRQAIAYCLDRAALMEQAVQSSVVLLNSYVSPIHPLYAGDENLALYPFDPFRGRELLAENGWRDTDGDGLLDQGGESFSLVLSLRRSALRETIAPLIAEQLRDNCGIEAQVQIYGAEYFESGPEGVLFGRQYDLGGFSWQLTGQDPPCELYLSARIPQESQWGNLNTVGFRSAEYDAACLGALTSLDAAARQEYHVLAQQIFGENLPSLPLFARDRLLVLRPDVQGVVLDATAKSEFWNVENFDK
jgi:ABC-type transport system substrate-binding protein